MSLFLPTVAWKSEKTPAIVLLTLVLSKYGTEALEWQPELLRNELEDDLGIVIGDLQSDKLQAAIAILTSNAFEDQHEAFEKGCLCLCNIPADFSVSEPLEAEEIANALAEAELIRDGHDPLDFSDDVRAYAGRVFYEYGCSAPPKIFPSAIMPGNVNESDMTEKNDALNEIFEARKEFIQAQMAELKQYLS